MEFKGLRMWIVLDTNIYYNQWNLDGANFNAFRNFCNNTGAQLILPEIVRREVQNKYESEVAAAQTDLDKIAQKLTRLGITDHGVSGAVVNMNYNFYAVVCTQFRGVLDVPYEAVSHSDLVAKALGPKLPFRDGEKGYRDALMWLSVLDIARSTDYRGDIHFVNNNSKDFYLNKSGALELHPDLKQDIIDRGVRANFIPYVALNEFVEAMVPKDQHSIGWNEFYDEHNGRLDSAVSAAAVEWLDDAPLVELRGHFTSAGYPSAIMEGVFAANFEDWDGVEDSSILSMRKIDDARYFIDYGFDLRQLEVKLISPTGGHSYSFGNFGGYIDTEVDNEITTTTFFIRADFTASAIFNVESGEVEKVDMNGITIRYRR